MQNTGDGSKSKPRKRALFVCSAVILTIAMIAIIYISQNYDILDLAVIATVAMIAITSFIWNALPYIFVIGGLALAAKLIFTKKMEIKEKHYDHILNVDRKKEMDVVDMRQYSPLFSEFQILRYHDIL